MPQILDGKACSQSIREKLKAEVAVMTEKGLRPPHLRAIIVGNDGASQTYVGAKMKACEESGFFSSVVRLPESTTEAELLDKIEDVNESPDIDGLIVQLPLPKHISEEKVTQAIAAHKDVDGFHDINMGKLAKGEPEFIPATPYGIMLLLAEYGIETSGKHCVVIGRSNIVGRPMSILMSMPANPGNCTVTICHSRTANLAHHTLQADILIAALGRPLSVGPELVKPGAVVIDVGITRVDDASKKSGFRLLGDVDYDRVANLCSAITPVPGGVGPMTIAGLLMNTMKARKQHLPAAGNIA
jgi:methylenetetrahydrofolate dehydrogenase (NADP+) / methenyltetrahydrofolate cyclohydrolase